MDGISDTNKQVYSIPFGKKDIKGQIRAGIKHDLPRASTAVVGVISLLRRPPKPRKASGSSSLQNGSIASRGADKLALREDAT
ncbi:hypothetical protein ACU8KH_03108 [Lachancea thermotolerans]